MENYYMLEFEVPADMQAHVEARSAEHHAKVEELMAQGRIQSFSYSANAMRSWAIVKASSAIEVMRLIQELPLQDCMIPSIISLESHYSAAPRLATAAH
ncbi:muconolactone Delta-isomerase family protein [Saprospira sp. CCB-QB6]|uniref:muconolactone Delta-isomerase family protein n=1 Tax=Saprospira sp. CCB-QB6 TaxID=3023936 RepID=UPI00234A4379|nr:muconolactone Delta-isomerase family protein [Saprospira sp. CCB-QB6]WCL82500.1 muconolactone Delta-isomerase family protein [Saprospira sp. CCB-QB6]